MFATINEVTLNAPAGSDVWEELLRKACDDFYRAYKRFPIWIELSPEDHTIWSKRGVGFLVYPPHLGHQFLRYILWTRWQELDVAENENVPTGKAYLILNPPLNGRTIVPLQRTVPLP